MLLSIVIIFAVAVFLISYYTLPKVINDSQKWQSNRALRSSSRLENAFMFVQQRKMRLIYFIAPLVLGVLGLILFKLVGGIIGVIIGMAIPTVVTKILISKRKAKFSHQLIDTIMLISSSLKGGLSLPQSFEVVMEEMPPPICQEFSLIVRENKMGVSLEEALIKFNKRVPLEDVDLIVSSIRVARETGGDLTKVFSHLIDTIRDRMKIKDMVGTLTLQGRIQGIIMSALPPLFVIVILKFNPHHFDVFLRDDTGRMLLFAAIILQILAFFFIKKFSTVKI